jgi:hypothetical protein
MRICIVDTVSLTNDGQTYILHCSAVANNVRQPQGNSDRIPAAICCAMLHTCAYRNLISVCMALFEVDGVQHIILDTVLDVTPLRWSPYCHNLTTDSCDQNVRLQSRYHYDLYRTRLNRMSVENEEGHFASVPLQKQSSCRHSHLLFFYPT